MKKQQQAKPRNEEFMRATLEHANRNLTRPGKKGYKRPSPGSRKDW